MGTTLTATLRPSSRVNAASIAAESFDEIVRQHQRRVYRVIFLLVKDTDAADTLTQECFLRAYQKRTTFRGECALATWLLRIAVNLVRDHGKNRRISFWRKLVGLEDDHLSGDGTPPQYATPQPSPERILLARKRCRRFGPRSLAFRRNSKPSSCCGLRKRCRWPRSRKCFDSGLERSRRSYSARPPRSGNHEEQSCS